MVLDSKGRLPLGGNLVATARQAPVLVVTAESASRKVGELQECGCEVLTLPGGDGRVDLPALLAEMGRRRFTNVLVEGGGGVLGSFLDAGAIDEVHVFIAPRLAGGAGAHPLAGRGVEKIALALRLSEWRWEDVAGDLYVHGWK